MALFLSVTAMVLYFFAVSSGVLCTFYLLIIQWKRPALCIYALYQYTYLKICKRLKPTHRYLESVIKQFLLWVQKLVIFLNLTLFNWDQHTDFIYKELIHFFIWSVFHAVFKSISLTWRQPASWWKETGNIWGERQILIDWQNAMLMEYDGILRHNIHNTFWHPSKTLFQ